MYFFRSIFYYVLIVNVCDNAEIIYFMDYISPFISNCNLFSKFRSVSDRERVCRFLQIEKEILLLYLYSIFIPKIHYQFGQQLDKKNVIRTHKNKQTVCKVNKDII